MSGVDSRRDHLAQGFLEQKTLPRGRAGTFSAILKESFGELLSHPPE